MLIPCIKRTQAIILPIERVKNCVKTITHGTRSSSMPEGNLFLHVGPKFQKETKNVKLILA